MKELEIKKLKLQFQGQVLCEDEKIKASLLGLTKFKVLKMTRTIQSAFYFLGYKREDICEKGTNKLFWKIAKTHFDDEFLKRIMTYNPSGAKDGEFKRYALLNFIEKNLAEVVQEDVDAYNNSLGRLVRWLQTAILVRKEDIARRKV